MVAESATTLVGAAAGGELAAAVAVIAPAVLPVTAHVTMDRRQFTGEKYKDVKAAPTEALVAAHLQGPTIRGSGLCWDDPATTSGRAARAIAWDSDDALGRLVASAGLLRRRGLRPLLVKNPSKPSSGHLWLFLDANVDPTDALARAEEIAPELRTVRERFPDPETGGGRPGGRLRWPGGRYLPAEGPPVAVLVALAPEVGAPAWIAGDTPAGWAVIAGAVSHAPDLLVTWVDPARRPQRPRPRRAPMARPVQRGNASGGADGHGDVFKTFKVRYTVPDLVEVLPGNMFRSPWHADSSASCHLLADGGWYDHSRKRSGDAVALWCALHGYWPDGAEKPDYKAARPALAQHLGLTAQGAGT